MLPLQEILTIPQIGNKKEPLSPSIFGERDMEQSIVPRTSKELEEFTRQMTGVRDTTPQQWRQKQSPSKKRQNRSTAIQTGGANGRRSRQPATELPETSKTASPRARDSSRSEEARWRSPISASPPPPPSSVVPRRYGWKVVGYARI